MQEYFGLNKHYLHLISRDVLWTLLAVAIIPSLGFWLLGQFWFIDRAVFNIDYMVLGLALIPFGVATVGLAFALILVLDVVFSVAPAYHFSMTSVIDSIWDLLSLEPGFLAVEISKVMLIVLVGTVLVRLALKKAQNSKTVAITCLLAAIIVSFLDFSFSANVIANRDAYTLNTNIAASSINNLRIAVSTADRNAQIQDIRPAESASELLRDSMHTGGDKFQTTILIVVESFGAFTNPAVNDYQMEPVLALKNQAGIVIKSGTVEFQGSTVPGELRELCGIKLLAVHPDASLLPTDECLPKTFHNRAYRTWAIHGFLGTLFGRNRWYPSLEFDNIWFAPELDAQIANAKRCGIAFHGICDNEVWRLIEELDSKESDAKRFIYWLTLSAHLPIENSRQANAESCASFDMLLQHPGLCNLVLQHRELFPTLQQASSKES